MVRTERLLLRRWRDEDREPFYQMNSDPQVMRYFPACLSREESDALIDRAEAHFERHGFGPFAVELLSGREFIGFIGLTVPTFTAHFTPCVEVGWRIAAAYWNQGLTTEGAIACVRYGFGTPGLDEIVSFTAPANLPSRRVMQKIGMGLTKPMTSTIRSCRKAILREGTFYIVWRGQLIEKQKEVC